MHRNQPVLPSHLVRAGFLGAADNIVGFGLPALTRGSRALNADPGGAVVRGTAR